MFNNKFNSSKKDPLVEAVMEAQKDGAIRRQAVALVNEEFGVFNRNAVVREQLAAYDARIEEAYKCMKEGDVQSIMNPNSDWRKRVDADKSNPFNEPTPDPTKVAPNIMMKGAQGDGTRTIADKVKSLFKEGKKVDQDKDGDNDFADVMIARMKKGGKSHDQAVSATKSKPYNIKEKKMWEGSEDTGTNQPTQASKDIAAKTASQTPDKPYADRGPSGAEKSALTSKIKAMNEAQLDELRQETISSYIGKAHARMKAAKESGFKKGGFDEKKGPKASKARAEFAKRGRGLGMAGRKLAEEEQINELTGKGKLPQMKANYQDAKKIHSNEADWHAARADRAERRGESKKAEHHMDAGYGHEEKAERAGSKLKRANALMTRAKAVSDIKSSKAASKSARAEYKEETQIGEARLSEIAMTTPPAIVQPAVPSMKQTAPGIKSTGQFGRQGASARPMRPTSQSVPRGMSNPLKSPSGISNPLKSPTSSFSPTTSASPVVTYTPVPPAATLPPWITLKNGIEGGVAGIIFNAKLLSMRILLVADTFTVVLLTIQFGPVVRLALSVGFKSSFNLVYPVVVAIMFCKMPSLVACQVSVVSFQTT